MQYRYRYVTDEGRPLVCCPYCESPLTEAGGIALELVRSADLPCEVASYLTGEIGWLCDPTSAVHEGRHSQTFCASCRKPLTDYEEQHVSEGSGLDEIRLVLTLRDWQLLDQALRLLLANYDEADEEALPGLHEEEIWLLCERLQSYLTSRKV